MSGPSGGVTKGSDCEREVRIETTGTCLCSGRVVSLKSGINAPELNFLNGKSVGKINKVTVTKESGVEASPNFLKSYLRSKPCVGLLPGIDGENAILQMERDRGVGKNTDWRTSTKTTRDRRRRYLACQGFSPVNDALPVHWTTQHLNDDPLSYERG